MQRALSDHAGLDENVNIRHERSRITSIRLWHRKHDCQVSEREGDDDIGTVDGADFFVDDHPTDPLLIAGEGQLYVPRRGLDAACYHSQYLRVARSKCRVRDHPRRSQQGANGLQGSECGPRYSQLDFLGDVVDLYHRRRRGVFDDDVHPSGVSAPRHVRLAAVAADFRRRRTATSTTASDHPVRFEHLDQLIVRVGVERIAAVALLV